MSELIWMEFFSSCFQNISSCSLKSYFAHFQFFFCCSVLGAAKCRYNPLCIQFWVLKVNFLQQSTMLWPTPQPPALPFVPALSLPFALTQHICSPPPKTPPKAPSLFSFRSGQLSALYCFIPHFTIYAHLLPDSFPCNFSSPLLTNLSITPYNLSYHIHPLILHAH